MALPWRSINGPSCAAGHAREGRTLRFTRSRSAWPGLVRLVDGHGLSVVSWVPMDANGTAGSTVAARSHIHIDGDMVTLVDPNVIRTKPEIIAEHYAQVTRDYRACTDLLGDFERLAVVLASGAALSAGFAGFSFGFFSDPMVHWGRAIDGAVVAVAPMTVVAAAARLLGLGPRQLVRWLITVAIRLGR